MTHIERAKELRGDILAGLGRKGPMMKSDLMNLRAHRITSSQLSRALSVLVAERKIFKEGAYYTLGGVKQKIDARLWNRSVLS